MVEGPALRHYDAAAASRLVDVLVEVQQEIYGAAEPREFFSETPVPAPASWICRLRAGNWSRLRWTVSWPGYVYGFPLGRDSRWWRGLLTPVPGGMTDETGGRTFALCEVMVRKSHRGRGFGKALHDELLADRHEERATLVVEQDNARAGNAYRRWGWTRLGDVRPSWACT